MVDCSVMVRRIRRARWIPRLRPLCSPLIRHHQVPYLYIINRILQIYNTFDQPAPLHVHLATVDIWTETYLPWDQKEIKKVKNFPIPWILMASSFELFWRALFLERSAQRDVTGVERRL
jgi:hypothetical protein